MTATFFMKQCTCPMVDILNATQQGSTPVWCRWRLGCIWWGACWRHLANM